MGDSMKSQHPLSPTAHNCVEEVDEIIKCSKKSFFGLLTIDHDAQTKKLESLKCKDNKEKEFIKKYVETKRTTFSSKIGTISFIFSMLAITASFIMTLIFMIDPDNVEKFMLAYIAALILLVFTFFTLLLSYIEVFLEKDVREDIIMAMEDKWGNRDESCSMTKLNKIDEKLNGIIEHMANLNSICSKLKEIEKKIAGLNDENREQSNQ